MPLSQKSKALLRSRWLPPVIHALLFAMTWLTNLAQSQPLLDGPSRWGFGILFVADFPISLVAFSWMWDGRIAEALSFWGILGTAWWYLLGVWIEPGRKSARHGKPNN